MLTRRRTLAGLLAASGAVLGGLFGLLLFLVAVALTRRPSRSAGRPAGAGDDDRHRARFG